MKKIVAILLAMLLCISVTACGGSGDAPKDNSGDNSKVEKEAEPKIDITKMPAEEITNLFKAAGFPIDNIIIYDENTDGNGLLGRPNQYTSKNNFAVTTVEQFDPQEPVGGTIEVFTNPKDAQARKDYIASVSEAAPLFAQYIYLQKNVLLRIDYDVIPSVAKLFEDGLKILSEGKELPAYVAPQ